MFNFDINYFNIYQENNNNLLINDNNIIKENINKKNSLSKQWSYNDNMILLNHIKIYGNKWKTISQLMNKTESQVRNRYMRIIKGQNLIGKNKCKKCNMIKKGHNCIYNF